ncbi:MAG: FAD-dependent oxidoreductase [Phenylobacterium zucineum]|nr:MAG: FAD-dependent oxidoreductase [Phenylobacterium zucineum]
MNARPPKTTLEQWLDAFGLALASGAPDAVAALFVEDGFWRDFAAFTWDLRTLEGREAIRDMLAATPEAAKAGGWWVVPGAATGDTEGEIAFETATGWGRGYVRLRDGRCWTLLTVLDDLKGHEEPRGRRRRMAPPGDPAHPNANWQDLRRMEAEALGRTRQPYVLIVGGGQGGLALAARLRQLDVPTLVIDRHARVGDQWRSRYHALLLHDPVWYDHMPYVPFPETWPVFTPKDKLGDWMEAYASIMELNVWCGSTCRRARRDEATGVWEVEIERDGETIVVRPQHLVIATGNAGRPNLPAFPGAETFGGRILHSSAYTGAADHVGRRVAVIGSNNSAQDICADLARHGVDVTMVQRDSTHVIRSETFIEMMMKGAYSEDALERGIGTDLADLLGASLPLRVLTEPYRALNAAVAARDADFYARLEATGFMHDFGEDGTGMPLKYLRRASGYYIDVGAAELLISGAIKLRSRVGIDHIAPGELVLSDGAHLPADDIICATGFGTMDQWAADLISPEVGAKVGKVWGYGSDTTGDPGPWEGELRNMWKPTAQDGLWFHGGNLSQSRFYSRVLALQLKARQVQVR